MIDDKLRPTNRMERYVMREIDCRNDSRLLFPAYDRLRGLEMPDEGNKLFATISEMLECNPDKAALVRDWSGPRIWYYIERWINEMGCELSKE